MTVARIDAANVLVRGAVCTAVAAGLLWIVWRVLAIAKARTARHKADPWIDMLEVHEFLAVIGCGAAGLIAGTIGIAQITSVWAWVGMFEPQVWLARKILGL